MTGAARVAPGARADRWRLLAIAAALCAASLALFRPGYAMFDTVAQYAQARSHAYDDWHPPAMAQLWTVLLGIAGGGAAPMLVVQMAPYWLGLALIAMRLPRRAGLGVLAIGAWPVFLGWQAAVLKDTQMVAALLAAVGVVGWWRLAGRRMPWWAVLLVAGLLGYGVLVRANAVFAVAPLVAALLPWRFLPLRVAAGVAGMLAVLAAAGPINHGLLRAVPTGVERTEALYDLAGIAVRAGPVAGIDARAARMLARRGCVTPFFWDPLGEPSRCDALMDPLRAEPVGRLYADLAGAIVRHPLAYAAHRLAHLNSTWRWWVPAHWPSAAPPATGEGNVLGLASPSRRAGAWQGLAGRLVEWPLGWPIVWIAAALAGAVAAARRERSPARDLAAALFASALGLEASFAILSIASDLRYHLWLMIAIALGLVLLAPRPGRGLALAAALVGGVAGVGAAARAVLPLPPQTYAGMLQGGEMR